MKWSYHSQVRPADARLAALRSRFGPAQQLIALALALSLCIIAALAVSGRFNLAPSPTPTPSPTAAPAILAPATLVPVVTAVPVAVTPLAGAATAAPQAAKFSCGNGPAETRYVADRGGAIVFDGVEAGSGTLVTLQFRSSVQVYGMITGRTTGSSNKWYAVRYGDKCGYVWADPADSRLSKSQPK